jgi:hypothetical protein
VGGGPAAGNIDPAIVTELRAVPCPFVGLGSYRAMLVDDPQELGEGAERVKTFCQNVSLHRSHSFVLGLDPSIGRNEPRSWVGVIHRVLGPLCDPGIRSSWQDPDWRRRLQGNAFFGLCMLPSYAGTHSRRSDRLAVLLLQPEALFTAAGITGGPLRRHYTHAAHRAFAAAGRDFTSLHDQRVPKAARLLLDENGRGLEWWLPEPLCLEPTCQLCNRGEALTTPAP